jgi:hypothetical protein
MWAAQSPGDTEMLGDQSWSACGLCRGKSAVLVDRDVAHMFVIGDPHRMWTLEQFPASNAYQSSISESKPIHAAVIGAP